MDVDKGLATIELLAMDVDGVLTDGAISYNGEHDEVKRFHVGDGLGLVLMRQAGIHVAWISGRASAAVERRAAELRIPYVLQGIRDKRQVLCDLIATLGMHRAQVAYVGDDWNDLPAFPEVGIAIAVENAAPEVKRAADLITIARGGNGAIREVCDAILCSRCETDRALDRYLQSIMGPLVDPGHSQ